VDKVNATWEAIGDEGMAEVSTAISPEGRVVVVVDVDVDAVVDVAVDLATVGGGKVLRLSVGEALWEWVPMRMPTARATTAAAMPTKMSAVRRVVPSVDASTPLPTDAGSGPGRFRATAGRPVGLVITVVGSTPTSTMGVVGVSDLLEPQAEQTESGARFTVSHAPQRHTATAVGAARPRSRWVPHVAQWTSLTPLVALHEEHAQPSVISVFPFVRHPKTLPSELHPYQPA
jgi:hypothetical protein